MGGTFKHAGKTTWALTETITYVQPKIVRLSGQEPRYIIAFSWTEGPIRYRRIAYWSPNLSDILRRLSYVFQINARVDRVRRGHTNSGFPARLRILVNLGEAKVKGKEEVT